MNGRIFTAQPHLESKSWTLAKLLAKLVVLMEYKIKGKKASTVGVLVNPVKVSKNFDEIVLKLTFYHAHHIGFEISISFCVFSSDRLQMG